jgi:hypothetical protein
MKCVFVEKSWAGTKVDNQPVIWACCDAGSYRYEAPEQGDLMMDYSSYFPVVEITCQRSRRDDWQ